MIICLFVLESLQAKANSPTKDSPFLVRYLLVKNTISVSVSLSMKLKSKKCREVVVDFMQNANIVMHETYFYRQSGS